MESSRGSIFAEIGNPAIERAALGRAYALLIEAGRQRRLARERAQQSQATDEAGPRSGGSPRSLPPGARPGQDDQSIN